MYKYRLNREEGFVYLEQGDGKVDHVDHLDAVILWASPKFTDTLFGLVRQQWVQLAIFTREMQIAYLLLNGGRDNALSSWEFYVELVEDCGRTLSLVVTRFSLESAEMDFKYKFQQFDGPNFVARSQEWLKQNPKVSMVDESLPINTQVRLNKLYRAENRELVQKRVGLIY